MEIHHLWHFKHFCNFKKFLHSLSHIKHNFILLQNYELPDRVIFSHLYFYVFFLLLFIIVPCSLSWGNFSQFFRHHKNYLYFLYCKIKHLYLFLFLPRLFHIHIVYYCTYNTLLMDIVLPPSWLKCFCNNSTVTFHTCCITPVSLYFKLNFHLNY